MVSVEGNMGTGTVDRFKGGLLGLALGDAMGAPLEGGPVERMVWSLIGKTCQGCRRWTDDTQMSLDLAESLIAKGDLDQDDLAVRFAAGYRWSRGYGRGAATLLKRIRRGESWRSANRSVFGDGSYGNGGAMRAPVIGLFFSSKPNDLAHLARDATQVTHAHPMGMEGAVVIATTTAGALLGHSTGEILDLATSHCSEQPFIRKLKVAARWLNTDDQPEIEEVRRQMGNGIAAVDSCVTALYLGLRFRGSSFGNLISFIGGCGGDTDTIGAMAGAIWGAANGKSRLPEQHLNSLEDLARIEGIAEALFNASLKVKN